MNYYKILKESECHYNLQYKTGLNIDPLEFNPSGDCTSGGIYFSREDILAFIHYGPWIRKVTLPEDAQIYENPKGSKKWKANKVILGKREKITAEVIKRLINEGANPNIGDDYPLRWAIDNKYTEIAKILIPLSNPKIHNSIALRSATFYNQIDIVKLLIPVSDSKACNSYALRYAAEYGYTEIVKLLIPVSNPKACNSYALRWAAKCGHTEIIKLLIPVSNPNIYNNALQNAAKKEHIDIVKLLIPVSKINNKIINYCKKYCINQEILDLIIANKKES